MRNRFTSNCLFLFISILFTLLLVACNQDDSELVENEYKSLKIQIKTSTPIQSYSSNQGMDQLALISEFGTPTLSSSVLNDIGENTIEINTTAKKNKLLNLRIMYNSYSFTSDFQTIANCSNISVKIFFDGALVYDQSKDMGGTTATPNGCPDGNDWSLNYTTQ